MIKKLTLICVLIAVTTTVQGQIIQFPTFTTLSNSPTSTVYGQNVTFTATVFSMFAPTGSVAFFIDDTWFALALPIISINSTTSIRSEIRSDLSAGNHRIIAKYSGGAAFSSSSDTIYHTVNKANTSVGITTPGILFDQKTIQTWVSVTVNKPGEGTPSGVVDFYLDGSATPFGNGVLDLYGYVYLNLTMPFSAGKHTITARYRGDSNFNPSPMSASETFTILDITPKFANTANINKIYGDLPFALPAVSGGFSQPCNCSKTYNYRSDNPAVATVNASTGQVTVASVGEANIYVKQVVVFYGMQDINIDRFESPESAPVKVIVSRKPVTATGVTATKVYDGTNVFTNAQIDISGAVINGRVGSDAVTLSKTGVTGTFGPAVGSGMLTLSGNFTLTGAASNNYSLTQPAVTATITPQSSTPEKPFFNGSAISKMYGDLDFYLPFASGGLGCGQYSYRSDNPAVATVDEITGLVKIAGVGTANMRVKRLACGGVPDSPDSEPLPVTVSRKSVTISGITAFKVYDGTNLFTNAQIDIAGAVVNGRVGSDDVTVSKTGVTGRFGPAVGTGTLTLSGSFSLTGAKAENYTLSSQPTVTATISSASTVQIAVTARGGSSVYGESPANPGFSATGLTNGDTESVLTGLSNSFGITATTPAGAYTLSVIGTLTNPKYTITSRNTGTWTVQKRPITITALDKTILIGEAPTLEYAVTSGELVNGDVITGELYCAPPYTLGAHDITQGTISVSNNYDVTFIAGTLTVIGRNVTVVVDGITSERNGNSFFIHSTCGANSVEVNVHTDQPSAVSIHGVQQNPRQVALPNYGDNAFTITVGDDTYTLTVHKSIPPPVAFYDRFDDVLTVPVFVEGIGVVNSVEWFHNGVKMDRNSTKGYVEMKEEGAYYALLNSQYRTCEVIRTRNNTLSMSVFPNPVSAGGEITVNIEPDLMSQWTNTQSQLTNLQSPLLDARLQIHSIDGRLLKTLPVTETKFKLTAPALSGVAVLKLITKTGNKEVKLIVK